jgi:predicted TIM-barrel fold metal-dependent hydrolase
MLKSQALDAFGVRFGICHTLHGALAMRSEDMAAVFCRALNDWMAREWLDRDPRLRASILVPFEAADLAVEEIERRATDRRFVSVLMLVMPQMPIGRRAYWPIYAAAERHGLTIAVHAGSTYRQPPTSIGWPSTLIEDNFAQSAAFENALMSLIAEGVFSRYPALRVAFLESGYMWLPSFMWRAGKTWRGVRPEVPWVDRPPAEYVREHVRFSIQPHDAPPAADDLRAVLEQIGSDDVLLFATDYPHAQFEGMSALSPEFPPALARKILVDNPLATFPRLAPL